MALSGDVVPLVHELPKAGLAVTLIGAPARTPEDARSSEHSKPSNQTNDNEETNMNKEDEGKKLKKHYSTMSEEVRPTRDREFTQKKLTRKIDIRYLNEIKNFNQKIRSSYRLSCNQEKCPRIQERLNQHQLEHHHLRIEDNAMSTRTLCKDQAVNVSPTLSRLRLPKFVLPVPIDGRFVQTDITMLDFSPTRLFIPKHLRKISSDNWSKNIPLRQSETREILPKVNFYKEHLQNEISNWIQNVPLFYNLTFTNTVKDELVNHLAEKINTLAVEASEKSYEVKTKFEIESCLGKLPIWFHGSKRHQVLFKDGLREKLWGKVQELNEKFLGIKYERPVEQENQVQKSISINSYEKEVVDWSRSLLLSSSQKSVTRRKVVDLIMKRLSPLLKVPLHTTSYKLILKGEIIDVLDDLPLKLSNQKYRTVHLNRFAEELANRLLTIQIKRESNAKNERKDAVFHQCISQVMGLPTPKPQVNFKKVIADKVAECIDKVPVYQRNDVITEICGVFLDSKHCLCTGDELSIKNKICQILRDTGVFYGDRPQIEAKLIIKKVKDEIKNIKNSTATCFDSVMPQLSGTISVYMWGRDHPPATSTPKKQSQKEIPKLNPEETDYMEKVATLVRKWMNTLPRQQNENKTYKETIIYDLAGDIMDETKLEQLAPDTITDKDRNLNYIVYRWLYRFQFFDEDNLRKDAKPFVADFLEQLKSIKVPKLTTPHHGTRQAIGAIKHMQSEGGWAEDYVAKGIDVIADQISVWMNDQPSEIYINKDKRKQDEVVRDLALILQDHLRNKSPESEIEKDINSWINQIVTRKEREHIGLLSEDLKEKVIHLPQDRTIEGRHEERKRYMAIKLADKRREREIGYSPPPIQDVSNLGNIEGDPDRTIREFIAKFIKHNYDVDDPMAIGAFSHLLKTELRKLSPPTRKEVYDNFEEAKKHEKFLPESMKHELEYIKIISDWLKNIPIEASYNTPGNKDRIEFINDLARNLQEIEEQRKENPDAMEYNFLTASMVLQSMHTFGLPILPEHKNNTPLMVQQLLQNLVAMHPQEISSKYLQATSPKDESTSESLMMSDIKEQNLSDFIGDYIRINGRDIADDEMKLEAWTARLLKEIKKMIHAGADPTTLGKAQVYDKFSEVPIPTDESVRRFSLEITYIKEISEWLKNLPLLPITDDPEAEEKRIKMISELSEKFCEREAQRHSDPNNNAADEKLKEYISNWISELPLDNSKEIVEEIVIEQLMVRIDRVNTKREQTSSAQLSVKEPESINEISKTVSFDNSERQIKIQKESKQSVSNKASKLCVDFLKSKKTPAEVIVEAIEKWSNKLPIKGDNKEVVKSMKEGIARELYKKVGELNVDPSIFDDDSIYREMLGDEIDTQLENVPQNSELQIKREQLKDRLLNTILDTREVIKERAAGDNYRHKLETTIDASIPNPVQSIQAFDPEFEIYKNHLANMFILENFDHANDDVKANYERSVRQEIDKYFESAQNKNALPLTKDQIYNELYSALFKVPMPSETSVIDEVEQVKTRCEINTWFEDLPLRQAENINEQLEWDKILSTLAKRIHEIEKRDPKADKKLHQEICKWLEKLPLLPGYDGIDNYAKKLQSTLKSTAAARKHVPFDPKAKGKSKLVKESKGKKDTSNMSQVAGPSSADQNYVSPTRAPQSKATNAKPCLQVYPMAKKKPGDLIVDLVEEWCNKLPLISTEENNRAIKDNASTRIIIQISELNMDPEIFNDDVVYDDLLDEELESVLANLPVCCDFAKSKHARKSQLKELIKSIKPLIKQEKARHKYKEEINSTVASILNKPPNTTADKVALFNQLKEEIVENFIQYNYNKNDEEEKQVYKNKIDDAVHKFCLDIRDNEACSPNADPLVTRNQLLCELEKIPTPNEALKEEVEEIKMKNEVEEFFNEQLVPEGDAENKMKKNLSKRLCDLEKSGHNTDNDKKMKTDISRSLKKLKIDVTPETIEDFVNKLRNNESIRKTPPLTRSQAANLDQSGFPGSPRTMGTGEAGSMRTPLAASTPYQYHPIPQSPASIQTRDTSSTPHQYHTIPFTPAPIQTGNIGSTPQHYHTIPYSSGPIQTGDSGFSPQQHHTIPYSPGPIQTEDSGFTPQQHHTIPYSPGPIQTGDSGFTPQQHHTIPYTPAPIQTGDFTPQQHHTIPYSPAPIQTGDSGFTPQQHHTIPYTPVPVQTGAAASTPQQYHTIPYTPVPVHTGDTSSTPQQYHNIPYSPAPIQTGDTSSSPHQYNTIPYTPTPIQTGDTTPHQYHTIPYTPVPIQIRDTEHFIALPPATPPRMQDSGYHMIHERDHRPDIQGRSPYATNAADQSFGPSAISYGDFEGGALLSSSIAPQGYIAPDMGRSNVTYNSFARGPLVSSSLTQSKQPSHYPSPKSKSRSQVQQGYRSIREATSGPMLSHPSYGQIATPRQVAQSPHHASPTSGQYATTSGDSTPDSLFRAPAFKPVPLHRPLFVPSIDPYPLPESSASMHDPRRSLMRQENAPRLSTSGLSIAVPPILRRPISYESFDEEELCICERNARKKFRGLPFCMFALDDYVDDCIGCGPMWFGPHYSECFYY